MYIVQIFKSRYCVVTFGISLVLSYFLIPKTAFYGWYTVLPLLFMLSFALTLTCIVRNVKERVLLAKTSGSSIVGIVAAALGLTALQVCGIGAPVCGASVAMGVLSAIFPTAFVGWLSRYAVQFTLFSILLQVVALYFMNCFQPMSQEVETDFFM